jgi:ABC-type glycerol-3-phosphate transport system permease component
MIWNTVWFAFGSTFMKLAVTTLAAYTIARYNFFGKKALYGFLILQLMLPIYGQTVANYKLLLSMNLIDTPLFLLALGAGHGMYFSYTSQLFHKFAVRF